MRVVLPFVILLGVVACSREPGPAVAANRPAAATPAPSVDDSVAAVVQSPGKPAISMRFALDGRPRAGMTSQLRLDLAGQPGPLSLQLQGDGLVLEPHSLTLTIAEDGKPVSQLVALSPRAAGIAEIVAKVQSSADGGQELVFAIPLLVEGAAAR